VADDDKTDEVGYMKPPKRTQFTKGKSGNPKGRPKGSQNVATLMEMIDRQLVQVTENGRTRYVTKFRAMVLQLTNKALRGDIRAIHEYRYWKQWSQESVEGTLPAAIPHERDEAVFASIMERLRQSALQVPEELQSDLSAGDADLSKKTE